MSIDASEIREDTIQIDGRRHIREVHTDHVGVEHHFVWMAEPGQNVSGVMTARAAWLPDYLAEQEIDANMEEVENG